MREWYVTDARAIDVPVEAGPEGWSEIKAAFPVRAIRRMSPLGLMLSWLIKDRPPAEDWTVVYATTFTEANALERYLDSFPEASPQGFQSSIHPAGIEQALIHLQQPVGEFFPLAGEANIATRALTTLNLARTGHALLCGGEEAATWLSEVGLASRKNFAFALQLARDPQGALGRIRPASGPPEGEAANPSGLPDLWDAVARRRSRVFGSPQSGYFSLEWW